MSLDRLQIIQGDITKQEVDAIVNAANRTLMGGGGVDGAIHRGAGEELVKECVDRYPRGCPTGEARITGAHELPAEFVIHTVGPVYRGGDRGEPGLLTSCYLECMKLAAAVHVKTIAFPAISCGVYGYPLDEAAEIALNTLVSGLVEFPKILEVRMVLFQKQVLEVFQAQVAGITIPQRDQPEEEPEHEEKPQKKYVDRRRKPSKPIEW